MDTPQVVLRFRDTTPGIDTIDEHRALISSEGATWWGWWRKDVEPKHSDLFSRLQSTGKGEVFIVDRSTDRMFQATFIRAFAAGSGEVDPLRIPQYYRDKADLVSAWFLLTKIESTEFGASIARLLGESTLLVLDGAEHREKRPRLMESSVERSCLLHLSDLHFGADYAYLPQGATSRIGDHRYTLTDCLLADLKRIDVDKDIAIVLVH